MARIGITYRFEEKLVPYAAAIRAVGLEPVPLAPSAARSLDGLDGLLISGGVDLNPALYGQAAAPETETSDDERDAMEVALVRQALDRDFPLLCICRGMQLLNVAQGGDLVQHLPQVSVHRQIGVHDAHPVRTVPGSRLAAIGGPAYHINSRHHQAVEKLGSGLVASAYSDDGILEGLELPGRRFAVAVQWHPEDRVASSAEDRRLFQAFAEAVAQASRTT